MGNMSYCRFQNTDRDLHDCIVALEGGEELSREEFQALQGMVTRCERLLELALYAREEREYDDEYENGVLN